MIGLEHVLLPLPDPWTVGRNPGLFTGDDRSVGSLLAVAQTPTWKRFARLDAAGRIRAQSRPAGQKTYVRLRPIVAGMRDLALPHMLRALRAGRAA
jgi:hypothetical protein